MEEWKSASPGLLWEGGCYNRTNEQKVCALYKTLNSNVEESWSSKPPFYNASRFSVFCAFLVSVKASGNAQQSG